MTKTVRPAAHAGRRRRLPHGFVLALLVAPLLLPGAADAKSKLHVPRGWMGVNSDLELYRFESLIPGEFRLMRRSGVQSVRIPLDWSVIEERQGHFDWSAPDAQMAAAGRNHLDPMAVVVTAPVWAGTAPRQGFGVYRPRSVRVFSSFLRTVVRRYGRHGSFWRRHPKLHAQPVHKWQIWNEPNISFYWPQPWAKSYAKYLKAAHSIVHRADRSKGRVVLGGLTNFAWVDLPALYKAHARRYFDAVAVHPYTHAKSDAVTAAHTVDFARYTRQIMRKHGDGKKPMYITEVGLTSGAGRTHSSSDFVNTTVKGQARLVSKILTGFARARRSVGIAGVYWYSWITRDESTVQPFDYAGLRTFANGRPKSKPALKAYQQTARRLEGRR
jgi:polysaccharide biosynthesis protein PslG